MFKKHKFGCSLTTLTVIWLLSGWKRPSIHLMSKATKITKGTRRKMTNYWISTNLNLYSIVKPIKTTWLTETMKIYLLTPPLFAWGYPVTLNPNRNSLKSSGSGSPWDLDSLLFDLLLSPFPGLLAMSAPKSQGKRRRGFLCDLQNLHDASSTRPCILECFLP